MRELLLDTHALIWCVNQDQKLQAQAPLWIQAAQDRDALYLSPVSAWEAAVAFMKSKETSRPNLLGFAPDRWFSYAVHALQAKVLDVNTEIALETARVSHRLGYGDPGDCFLIATARVHDLTLMTRDARILALASREPAYLAVLAC